AQPDAKWHRPIHQEVVHPPHNLHLRVLHDVGRVDPGSQARIEVQHDEVVHCRSVPLEQPLQGFPVPLANPLQERASLGRIRLDVWHQYPPPLYPPSSEKCDHRAKKNSEVDGGRTHNGRAMPSGQWSVVGPDCLQHSPTTTHSWLN